ncbi:bifunctional aspartate kinase/homoserine dehydrogenase I [Sphingosinicella rhizophila]|uniref:Aspartokinase n=1 Tax=Sphingosinicella rhizophila TaxID=3050082 RepID=A0ABU3QCQ8_9SPHN|nr:bifunctional aspartate kinase/homoserine dehydrogenase I [Sphingosinicella sp. GR2756]MDT9600745.1 bifunctional aspartate kinase/homoserine dehydrogenase I [Sphingosinicella sp. GR2756]
MIIHKFGGTSLADAAGFRRAATIVAAAARPSIVVVSAIAGVTDGLCAVVEAAVARDPSYREQLAGLQTTHVRAARELLPEDDAAILVDRFERDFEDLNDVLRAAWILRDASRGTFDMVAGYGETWSAQLLAGLLRVQAVAGDWMDAREVLVVAPNGGGVPEILWDDCRERLGAWRESHPATSDILVVTGFIASTREGVPATLGRNGSDYTASIFAALLEAEEVHIWSDVDGVMSADPRLVPDAVLLEAISYPEASELAYYGAKFIHPATMGPVIERAIPVWIRNSFNAGGQGTRIHVSGTSQRVKGLSTVESVALVNVEGSGLAAVAGMTDRLFHALREANISTLMVSQGSSRRSICVVVPAADAGRVKPVVEAAFMLERHHGTIQTIEVDPDCTLLAVVGDGMAGHPGVAARFFGALGKAGVNIRAIAQGSSERNISVVVERSDRIRALRAAHSGLYLSAQSISVGLLGIGTVGGVLLDQLAARLAAIREELGIDLRVRAIANTRTMRLDDRRIDLTDWRDRAEGGEPFDLERFLGHVQTDSLPHSMIIDCTSSEALARQYVDWLKRGIHIVTPNKKAGSADFAYFEQLRRASRESNAHYLYETTVGAGLPVLQTLRDLIQTGDEVVRIEGVLSGTLSYLFNSFDGSRPFSEVVAEARAKGFTEPDPRDDLSGMDVARKVVILAREMGLRTELEDVELQGLVPPGLEEGSVDTFLERLRDHDSQITALFDEAKAKGEKLRFVGSIDRDERATVRLQSVPDSHALARLHFTDNMVQFQTSRYTPNPLIVQGPGAGPEVTAGGIFADMLRLAAYLGAS